VLPQKQESIKNQWDIAKLLIPPGNLTPRINIFNQPPQGLYDNIASFQPLFLM